MSTSKVYSRPVRGGSEYFIDHDGELATSKRDDEKLQLVIDWSDQLNGDTINSVSYDERGVAASGMSNTTTTSTVTVSDVGELEITVTTAAGSILQRVVRFYDSASPAGARDYQL